MAVAERQLIDGPGRRQRGENGEWIRGQCPMCGEDVVSNCYFVAARGGNYIIVWECTGSLAEPPACDYRRVL